MVLISINAVLRLLKWSTCVRGRTHLAVVAICRFDAETQSRGARLWLVIIIIKTVLLTFHIHEVLSIHAKSSIAQVQHFCGNN